MSAASQSKDSRTAPLLARAKAASGAAYGSRPLRFLVIGALNTAVGYAIFYVTLAVTGGSFVALVVMMTLGVLFNFFSTGTLVFNSRDRRLLHRFIGVYGVVFLVNFVCLRALEGLGVGSALAQALLTPFLAYLSYRLNRDFVFPDDRKAGTAA
jgi:putative flippase GtrA